ncbi:long-chain fatty acid transport protein [Azospirillum sp. B510]|uniref:OmpP1/FadL family transporter n=1 Tax=Azospirillum sp. (strain B510) TaxID=137722 RepID=UPI0001C4C82F|nr:outer membrane protein transport protein [Azospirillum sp. B510]BAI73458.1 long-chain fatty acid transport protein [Azospirillum sp. B510]
MRRFHLSAIAGLVLAASVPHTAAATDGYFTHGVGTQAKGMAGAAIAYPKEALSIAVNPASATALGNRFDIGAEYFRPTRSSTIRGNGFGPDQSFGGNDKGAFYIPDLGYVRQIDDRLAVGLAVYGNGGMNTDYRDNPYARFGATGKAGVDLQQLFLSPTVAYRIAEGHSLGIALNIVNTRFKAQGIGAFARLSEQPSAVSNKDRDDAWGAGLRIGWLGQLTPWLSVGASWQSKSHGGSLRKYRGLFADQGDFDVPAAYGVGIAVKASEALDIAVDVRRIAYSDVGAVGNDFQRLFTGKALGSDDGPGFGWKDTTSIKIGANYRIGPDWQVRAGYGYTTQPIPRGQTFLNILAPGAIQHQITAGATWSATKDIDVSVYGLYGLPASVKGSGSIPGAFGGGEANIRLSEVALGGGLAWRF